MSLLTTVQPLQDSPNMDMDKRLFTTGLAITRGCGNGMGGEMERVSRVVQDMVRMASPNTCASGFDAAWPGTLPKLNAKCVELAVRMALVCGSQVQPRSTFDGKHYFYADLLNAMLLWLSEDRSTLTTLLIQSLSELNKYN
ncbi:hypothetical protein K439DRAFT_1619887 [Ramaria rubella]|nr:hypothetical protein K439DRAFT_1619887 [Ramaria rubella]